MVVLKAAMKASMPFYGVYGVFDFKLNFEKNQFHFYGK